MKVRINKEKCLGCGTCTILASKSFKLADDGKAEVLEPYGDDEQIIREAADSCPMGAIEVVEE